MVIEPSGYQETAELVVVHVRRGDYVSLSHLFVNLSATYYRRACAKFSPQAQFWIFTDDPLMVSQEVEEWKEIQGRYHVISGDLLERAIAFASEGGAEVGPVKSLNWDSFPNVHMSYYPIPLLLGRPLTVDDRALT